MFKMNNFACNVLNELKLLICIIMAKNKTQQTDQSPLQFLQNLEDVVKSEDSIKILKMLEEITKMEAKMWGPAMIGYGSYTYTHDSGSSGEIFIIGFSPRKANITIYYGAKYPEMEQDLEKLGKYKWEGSCLHFKKMADINADVLKSILKKCFVAKKKII